MNITYLVDLENIGTKLLLQHAEEHKDGEYIIFYSDNTSAPDCLLRELPDTTYVTFVNCKTGGNNAMDFCICAMAGKLSAHRTKKMEILSNDKGYDSMIHMLQEQGTRIIREDIIFVQEQEEKPVSCNQAISQLSRENVIAVIKKNAPKKYQKELLDTIPHALTRKEAHEMCQAILPMNIAAEVYRKLRKHIPKEAI